MPINLVATSNTFNQWREATNSTIVALAELEGKVGDTTYLPNGSSSVVGSINQLADTQGTLGNLAPDIISSNLIEAINRSYTILNTNMGPLSSLINSEPNLVESINSLISRIVAIETAIGQLSSLNTPTKTNLVGAINEAYAT